VVSILLILISVLLMHSDNQKAGPVKP
jgi:hypothetical protein